MNWLLWRQHRTQMAITGVMVAVFALLVVITGVHMAHVYDDVVRSCAADQACDPLGHLFNGDGAIIDLVHLSIAVPLLLGVFLGATLIARETEHSTNVLVWTQTVTRRRWLVTKVGTALAATVVVSGMVSVLVTWWSGTMNSLNGDRFQGAQFDTQNVTPVAFALFAVALGLAAGALLRRTLPALAATVGIYAGVRLLVAIYLRPHYLKPITQSFPFARDVQLPSGSWTLSTHVLDPSGQVLGNQLVVPSQCRSSPARDSIASCLDRLGYHTVVRYQPASRYWQFQWIEAAVFLGLAGALVAVALVHTLRHDA